MKKTIIGIALSLCLIFQFTTPALATEIIEDLDLEICLGEIDEAQTGRILAGEGISYADNTMEGRNAQAFFYSAWTYVDHIGATRANVGLELATTEDFRYAFMELYVYNERTGELVGVYSDSAYNSNSLTILEVLTGLSPGTRYRLYGSISIIPPIGYNPIGVFNTSARFFETL